MKDKQRSGRANEIPVQIVERVISEATRPIKPMTRQSVRSMAASVGISPDSVHRIWRENDLKSHLRRTFKVSTETKRG